jgi:preprotein translocase subunit SecA
MDDALYIPRPGTSVGAYPERKNAPDVSVQYWQEMLRARLSCARAPSARYKQRILDMLHAKRAELAVRSTEEIAAHAKSLRSTLIIDGLRTALAAETLAAVGLVIERHFSITLHDQQYLGARLALGRRLIEMQTGEGKTLAVALAAIVGGLAGTSVHVVTANDYLAERDAASIAPVLTMLGLSGTAITGATPLAERPNRYRSDVVYCTAKELVFDYLRDRSMPAAQRAVSRNLRGLCMAIIDEADSVLIDEARTPFILSESQPNKQQAAFYRQALFLASQMRDGDDYRPDPESMSVELSAAGKARAQALSEPMGDTWCNTRLREEALSLALAAQHLFVKDKHYIINGTGAERKIAIVDGTTGRQAQGRIWSRGLHQLVEAKEGCMITEPSQTVMQITFQRFFSRYLHLSGFSGTLTESSGELLAMYRLPVAALAPRSPALRDALPDRVFRTRQAQWQYVIEQAGALHARGRPVLIGTDSVRDSETLSRLFDSARLPHAVLNARFDAEEAGIVARAGAAGAITISTNMAGRGTDVALGPGVAAAGGLHIISCQANHAKRIDRQLFGRCARQGQPGSVEQLYCVEGKTGTWQRVFALLQSFSAVPARSALPSWYASLFRFEQNLRQRYARKEQWFMFIADRHAEQEMAMLGRDG